MIAGDDLDLFERSLSHAAATHTGAALDAALDELGWPDALAADPRAAVALLFGLQGAADVTSSALDQVLAGALGRDGHPAVLLPAVGREDAPGRFEGPHLAVEGIATAHLAEAATALVVARTGDAHVAYEVAPAALPRRPVAGMDPKLSLVELSGDVVGAVVVGPVDWAGAVAAGQRALGHELVGASRRMLELAREHALGRVQFGRPIARFQAVRHRLAETLVAIEAADALLDAAWLDGGHEPAAMAKAQAGRSARTAARHCQQVLAGIGFTTEHPLHRHVRRTFVLEQLLGATATLTRNLGRAVLDTGHLPPLLPL